MTNIDNDRINVTNVTTFDYLFMTLKVRLAFCIDFFFFFKCM